MTAKKTAAKKTASRKTATDETSAEPTKPVVTKTLQIRIDGKVTFSQEVDASSVDMSYKGGNLTVSAAVVGADEVETPVMIPVDQIGDILGTSQPVDAEDLANPNVDLQIHAGRRPAMDNQQVAEQRTEADVAADHPDPDDDEDDEPTDDDQD